MTPEVEQAIEELKINFPESTVEVKPETQGGAYVTVHNLDFGEKYTPRQGWVKFLISFQYPRADVYPHHIDLVIKRSDDKKFGKGFGGGEFLQQKTLQISRRSKRLDPSIDTAALKLAKVIDWLKEQKGV